MKRTADQTSPATFERTIRDAHLEKKISSGKSPSGGGHKRKAKADWGNHSPMNEGKIQQRETRSLNNKQTRKKRMRVDGSEREKGAWGTC